jgi:processive 1,2-diacylglycerol beta-glucosyltransferase
MIKILIINPEPLSGVGFHRLTVPNAKLDGKGFDISGTASIDNYTIGMLKEFQIVVFNRTISKLPTATVEDEKKLLLRLKTLGIVSVCDLDDFWELPVNHYYYSYFRQFNVPEREKYCVKNSDHVITTTQFFADIIKKLNPKVTVIQNAIDPDQPQWAYNKEKSNRVRFGFVGSAFHKNNVEILKPAMSYLHQDEKLKRKYELLLCGLEKIDEAGLTEKEWEKKQGIYGEYEKIFKTGLKDNNEKAYNYIYRCDVNTYGAMYDLFDVALAPLENILWNNCKSELKMIEAGFKKTAILVSDCQPFTSIAKNGYNCLTVKPKGKYMPDWYLKMKQLILNPNQIEDLSEQLYEDVKVRFHISTANEIRADLYKNLVK